MDFINTTKLTELMNKFNYASCGNSRLQDNIVVEENLIPEQKYRACLVNLHGKISTLKEYYFKQRKNQNLKRKYEKQLDLLLRRSVRDFEIEFEIEDLKIKIEKLELDEIISAPLLKDAINSANFFTAKLEEIEKQGLRPFEEATLEYQKLRALNEARLELISKDVGLSKNAIEMMNRYGCKFNEILAFENLKPELLEAKA